MLSSPLRPSSTIRILSSAEPRNAAGLPGGYPSRPAPQASSHSLFWVASSFLRQCDETKTLLKSQYQIWAIGADAEQLSVPTC